MPFSTLTFTQPGRLVAQHVDLMHPAKLLEHLLQLLFVHRARHLPDEHLDIVRIGLVPDGFIVLLAATANDDTVARRGRWYQLQPAARATRTAEDVNATTTTAMATDDVRVVLVYHIGVVVVQRGMIVIVGAAVAVAVIVSGGIEVVVVGGAIVVVVVHIHEGAAMR